jgi:transporter family-2 protein
MLSGAADGLPKLLAVLAALLLGSAVSVQSRLTADLAQELGDSYAAAVVTFAGGSAVLALLIICSSGARTGFSRVADAVRSRRLPWWTLLTGFGGALFVIAQGSAASALGVAVFTMAVIAGQVVSGFLLDARGAAGVRVRPSALRVAGASVALASVAWAGSSQGANLIDPSLILLAFAAGFIGGWVNAANGRVLRVARSAVTSSSINFAVGLLVVGSLWGAAAISTGLPEAAPTNPVLYLTGLVGIVVVAGTGFLVRVLGVLLLGLAMVSGQLVGALIIDLFAPADNYELQISTVAGAGLTLVAVALLYLDMTRKRPQLELASEEVK